MAGRIMKDKASWMDDPAWNRGSSTSPPPVVEFSFEYPLAEYQKQALAQQHRSALDPSKSVFSPLKPGWAEIAESDPMLQWEKLVQEHLKRPTSGSPFPTFKPPTPRKTVFMPTPAPSIGWLDKFIQEWLSSMEKPVEEKPDIPEKVPEVIEALHEVMDLLGLTY